MRWRSRKGIPPPLPPPAPAHPVTQREEGPLAQLDLAVLRAMYAVKVREEDRAEATKARLVDEIGRLPAVAALVLTLFFAFAPRHGSALVSILYLVGTIPFVLIVIGVVLARGSLGLGLAFLPGQSRGFGTSEREWLQNELFRRRPPELEDRQIDEDFNTSLRIWRLYLLLALEVIYLAVVAAITPWIT
jgi:hypothetical protein